MEDRTLEAQETMQEDSSTEGERYIAPAITEIGKVAKVTLTKSGPLLDGTMTMQ